MGFVTLVASLAVAASSFASALLLVGNGSPDPPLVGHWLEGRVAELPAVAAARGRARLERQRSSCLREMPEMIDMLTLGLSAGLSFDASLDLYCERSHSGLSDRIEAAMLSWRIGLGSRSEALRGMADDLGLEVMRGFASVVSESLEFGTPLAESLDRQAQAIREARRSEIEEEIEKVPVRMLIPLGTLIVPAMLLAILGPLLGSALVVG